RRADRADPDLGRPRRPDVPGLLGRGAAGQRGADRRRAADRDDGGDPAAVPVGAAARPAGRHAQPPGAARHGGPDGGRVPGQDGSMCTLHANSPGEAFDRILILGLRGGLALAERAIHILVGMAVDLIVHVRRRYDGHRTVRYVSEILEVMPPGDTDRPSVNRMFLPGSTGLAAAAHSPSPGMMARL